MTANEQSPLLCAGIDPNPRGEHSFDHFKEHLQNHIDALRVLGPKIKILKPNMAFFLAHGSKGLALLEGFVNEFHESHRIILDSKFGEIDKTLKAYLMFAFAELKVHGITINSFLGEQSIRLSYEYAAKYSGSKGRVYVLCATSQFGRDLLAGFQTFSMPIIRACASIRDEMFGTDPSFQQLAGVVVGANREEIFFSPELYDSKLSLLCPGLGPQGADYSVVERSRLLPTEVTFPLSRKLFDEGRASPEDVIRNFEHVNAYFKIGKA